MSDCVNLESCDPGCVGCGKDGYRHSLDNVFAEVDVNRLTVICWIH